ncbi:MAG: prephenate dehydrogenase [Proteobacteria bacterium]|nr:prephenate dehydrogenase [Pseudomonadota bacterium]
MNEPRFNRLGVIGVGLIGASFALAFRERKLCKEIWGYSLSGNSAIKASELGIIDRKIDTIKEIGEGCDIIVVSTPVLTIPDILRELSLYVSKDTIVTDGGSVKNFVINAEKFFKYKNYVGAHPIAGTEKSGPEAGFSSLFDGSLCIVVETKNTSKKYLKRVVQIWESVGMTVEITSPETHDEIMAYVSHMPHTISFSLAFSVKDKLYNGKKLIKYAGGGFRDFTRIAKSDARMWTDIFLSNKGNVLKAIDDFQKSLEELKKMIENSSESDIFKFLDSSKRALLER